MMQSSTSIRPAAVCCTRSAQRSTCRSFSITSSRPIYVKNALRRVLPKDRREIPNYPYGPARWFKQSNKGLYGGLMIQHGNNIGEKFAIKTRRTWHPNIQPHSLYSRALGRPVRLRVATRVLRTIDKVGGLDEYLVGSNTSARIRELGVTGWALRWRILQTEVMRKRFGIGKREKDWLGQARRARMLDTVEEELEGTGKRGFDEGNALQERAEAIGEPEVDEETKREVQAFDRILDEEDRKAAVEVQEEPGTLAREGDKKVREAVEGEQADNKRESEMIQQRRGLMDQVRGLFDGKK